MPNPEYTAMTWATGFISVFITGLLCAFLGKLTKHDSFAAICGLISLITFVAAMAANSNGWITF